MAPIGSATLATSTVLALMCFLSTPWSDPNGRSQESAMAKKTAEPVIPELVEPGHNQIAAQSRAFDVPMFHDGQGEMEPSMASRFWPAAVFAAISLLLVIGSAWGVILLQCNPNDLAAADKAAVEKAATQKAEAVDRPAVEKATAGKAASKTASAGAPERAAAEKAAVEKDAATVEKDAAAAARVAVEKTAVEETEKAAAGPAVAACGRLSKEMDMSTIAHIATPLRLHAIPQSLHMAFLESAQPVDHAQGTPAPGLTCTTCEDMLSFSIENLIGETHVVRAFGGETVSDLKRRIQSQAKVHHGQIRLTQGLDVLEKNAMALADLHTTSLQMVTIRSLLAVGSGLSSRSCSAFIIDPSNGERQELACSTHEPTRVWCTAWNQQGTSIAIGMTEFKFDNVMHRVTIFSASAGLVESEFDHPGHVASVAWSPNGTWLATTQKHHVCVFDVASGVLKRLFKHRKVGSVAWSPDGAKLAIGCLSGQVWVEHVISLATEKCLGHGASIQGVAWSPDGSRIAIASAEGCTVMDVVTEVSEVSLAAGLVVNKVAWSPDGLHIATALGARGMKVFDLIVGEEVAHFEAMPDEINGISWNPDGAKLATACSDGYVRIFDIHEGTMDSQGALTAESEIWSGLPLTCVAWNP